MSSSADFSGEALQGRRLQRARHAAAFRDPDSPPRRLITRLPDVDWAAPREFEGAPSATRQMFAAARRKKVTKHEVQHAFRTFTLNGDVIGGLNHRTHSLVSDQAKRACRSRPLAKQHLQAVEVPTPDGRGFRVRELDEALAHRAQLDGPVVIRPATGSAGVGVSWGVRTEEEFRAAWAYAGAARTNPLYRSLSLLVEEQATGIDVRAYVVGEKTVAAVARLPLFIVGDGRATVRRLVDDAVAARARNAHLAKHPPEVDDDALADLGLRASEVLPRGEHRDVSGTSNPLQGGITVDITAELREAHAELAVEAMWALPGLRAAGVDLLIPDLDGDDGAVVVDVADDADISLHRYPSHGSLSRPANAVVEQMMRRARR
ncbi:hypothetical protein Q7C18_07025 [Nesterenkonia sp. CL21]|uniref:ATP-binding protein n=1 Tax=Nesterenkonia sp. CL21 TaxID=3064894 RepID=UPI00287ACA65|nr:hypothetical protein [Nesterenkonia sp. CL21]MDS2172442.1 hypothetical protein [Nesterenkonia sp. CL21]